MIVFPNAKINIGLRILRRRQDGFHDIESIFYPVGLSDILEIIPAAMSLNDENPAISSGGTESSSDIPDKSPLEGIDRLSVSGPVLRAADDNLCLRAAGLFRDRQTTPPVLMHLHKIIPLQSGLGGGSSDAGFTLMALNQLFGKGLDLQLLSSYASEIGSDCPFFILNRPCLVRGRGEVTEPVSLSLEGYFLVLLFPEATVSTSRAYSLVSPSDEGPSLKEFLTTGPQEWKNLPGNHFEEPVFNEFPEIARARELLYSRGALYASMSGSGSTVYGIFRDDPGRDFDGYRFYTEWMS